METQEVTLPLCWAYAEHCTSGIPKKVPLAFREIPHGTTHLNPIPSFTSGLEPVTRT